MKKHYIYIIETIETLKTKNRKNRNKNTWGAEADVLSFSSVLLHNSIVFVAVWTTLVHF